MAVERFDGEYFEDVVSFGDGCLEEEMVFDSILKHFGDTTLEANPGEGRSCLRCFSTLISAICCISCIMNSFCSATVGWATTTSVRLTSSLLFL